MIIDRQALIAALAAQDGWKAWKKALKQSNELDDNGYEDEAARSAAQMVADAHRKFSSKAGGKGKKGSSEEAEAEPYSLLHKVCCIVSKLACYKSCVKRSSKAVTGGGGGKGNQKQGG